jgi:transposase
VAVRKMEIKNPEVMSIAIRQEIERSDESRYDHRLHGVLLVANGQSCREVALLFGEDPRTVQRWVKRFEDGEGDSGQQG